MAARLPAKSLTQFALDALKPKDRDYEVSDGQRRLRVLVRKSGVRTWLVRTRVDDNGKSKSVVIVLGRVDQIPLKKARDLASEVLLKTNKGINPNDEKRKAAEAKRDAAQNTLRGICEEYLTRVCGMRRDDDGNAAFTGKTELRTGDQRLGIFERLVYPEPVSRKPIDDVRRSDVVRLLDKIDDERGPRMADMTLALIRKVMNWHATRSDTFETPIVPGMARTKPGECARDRILDDDELRAVWNAAGDAGAFGRMVRFILLTAARRDEAAKLSLSEIEGADWILPAARNKTKRFDLVRPLSQAALDIIAEGQRFAGCPFVFTTGGTKAIGGYGKAKAALDKASGTSGWTLHDLRRTARTLMSRAGIDSDHAERCLGHVIGGVRGVYDRHAYHAEKQRAFEALAAQIDRILNPPADNVVAIRG